MGTRIPAAIAATLCVASLTLFFAAQAVSATDRLHCRDALTAAETLQHATIAVTDRESERQEAEREPVGGQAAIDYTTAAERLGIAERDLVAAQNNYRNARPKCPK